MMEGANRRTPAFAATMMRGAVVGGMVCGAFVASVGFEYLCRL